MKKQSTLFAFKFRGKREKDKADSDSTVPAKSTDKADSGASRAWIMGRHSDSGDDRKRKKKAKRRSRSRSSSLDSHTSKHSKHKKSKKSSKHTRKSRSRSRSSERSHKSRIKKRSRSRSRDRRRSRSRSRSKPRAYRRSRSRSTSRSKKRSRSRSRSASRTRSRRSRSRSHRRSRTRSPRSRRSSRSRSRERSRRERSRSREWDKREKSPIGVPELKKEKVDPCANIPGFDLMTPSEQAETRLQMALKAAAAAGEKLKEQGVLGLSAATAPLTFQEQQSRSRAIENIESESFVQKVFKSSRQQGGESSADSLHENAIFGLGDLTLKTEASQELRAKDVESHMHPNLYIASEDKMDRWIKKLEGMRRRKLEGEAMD